MYNNSFGATMLKIIVVFSTDVQRQSCEYISLLPWCHSLPLWKTELEHKGGIKYNGNCNKLKTDSNITVCRGKILSGKVKKPFNPNETHSFIELYCYHHLFIEINKEVTSFDCSHYSELLVSIPQKSNLTTNINVGYSLYNNSFRTTTIKPFLLP